MDVCLGVFTWLCAWVCYNIHACIYVYICVYTCIRIYVGVHVCLCVYVEECIRVRGYICVFMCLVVCYSVTDLFGEIRTIAGDPDPIRICASYRPNTIAIRKSIHGMIRRSVPVRAVKTRRRFSSKTASFHVNVCSWVFLYLLLLVCAYMLLLSFHVTFCYILPIWLLVSLHEALVIIHLICVVDMILYQHYFMCWYNVRCWLRPSIDIP